MTIETLEIAGFAAVLKSARLPFSKSEKSAVKSEICTSPDGMSLMYGAHILFDAEDISHLCRLEERGDEHAKPLRGVIAYADITAPIDWWVELETYRVGHERLFSGSTMNTEGKKLHGKALREALNGVSFGREIRKIDFFSYQTLRRIVYQRYNHRKLEWHQFIDWVKTLPYADELILAGLEDKVLTHDRLFREYLEE